MRAMISTESRGVADGRHVPLPVHNAHVLYSFFWSWILAHGIVAFTSFGEMS